ncbi:MAG: MFS transporter [Firmicutes bacterium]|nr:MFS transporter [Bacillota bacterium]
MTNEKIGKRPHYAFLVLIACCTFTGVSVALYFSCGGIFYTPVSEYFGVGRGTYAISGTIMSITLGIFAPIMGSLIEKYSLRRLIILCLTAQTICYIAQSMFTSIYFFFITGAVHGIIHSLMMLLAIPVIISRWFETKRGFFTGLASSMSGVGGIILNMIAGPFLDAYGWRATFMLYGILVAVIPLPLAVFVLRDRPSSKGLMPYGHIEEVSNTEAYEAEASSLNASAEFETHRGVPYSTAKKSLAFWMLALVAIFTNTLTCFSSYMPSYATSLGMSITFGAGLASVMGIGILIGKNVTGILIDKSPVLGMTVSTLVPGLGFVLLYIFGTNAPNLMPIGSILYGVSYAATPVLLPLLVMLVFGTRDNSRILGSVSLYGSLVGALVTVVFGYISDIPHGFGFVIIIAICIASSVLSYICGGIALKSGKHLLRE